MRLSCGEGIYGIFKDLGQIDGKKEAPFSNGGGSDLYCSALRPLLVTTIDHYWSASGAVLLPSPTSSDRWQVFARRKRGKSVFCEEDTLHLELHSRAESHDTETVARSPQRQAVLVFVLDFAACGNRKALRLRAKGVYSCN